MTPFAVNWACRMASYSQTCQGSPNQCSFPEQQHGLEDEAIFGQCAFYNISEQQLALSHEVLAAASQEKAKRVLPRRNAKIQQNEVLFWNYTKPGVGMIPLNLDQNGEYSNFIHPQELHVSSVHQQNVLGLRHDGHSGCTKASRQSRLGQCTIDKKPGRVEDY